MVVQTLATAASRARHLGGGVVGAHLKVYVQRRRMRALAGEREAARPLAECGRAERAGEKRAGRDSGRRNKTARSGGRGELEGRSREAEGSAENTVGAGDVALIKRV